MRRLLIIACFLPVLSFARGSLSGYCTQGGQRIVTNTVPSATQAMQSYPQCSISVYYTNGPSGSVTTSGTAVTWISGTLFNANGQWPGLTVNINASPYTIASCASTTACTLTGSAGTQSSPVGYSMAATSPAAIYTSNGTSLTNPFVSSLQGYWQFYADNGPYDIKLSGGGIPAPFTWGNKELVDSLSLPNTASDLVCASSGCLQTLCSTAASLGRTLLLSATWDLNGTCAANIYAYNGGGFAPSSGHTTTLTGSFNGTLSRHFSVSSGGSFASTSSLSMADGMYPQWWGATGDGVTDDAPALRAATANLTAFGQNTLTVPPGTYVLKPSASVGVTISSGNVTIQCQNPNGAGTASSASSVFIAGADNMTLFEFTQNNAPPEGIEGCTFDLGSVSHGYTSVDGVFADTVIGLNISNNNFVGIPLGHAALKGGGLLYLTALLNAFHGAGRCVDLLNAYSSVTPTYGVNVATFQGQRTTGACSQGYRMSGLDITLTTMDWEGTLPSGTRAGFDFAEAGINTFWTSTGMYIESTGAGTGQAGVYSNGGGSVLVGSNITFSGTGSICDSVDTGVSMFYATHTGNQFRACGSAVYLDNVPVFSGAYPGSSGLRGGMDIEGNFFFNNATAGCTFGSDSGISGFGSFGSLSTPAILQCPDFGTIASRGITGSYQAFNSGTSFDVSNCAGGVCNVGMATLSSVTGTHPGQTFILNAAFGGTTTIANTFFHLASGVDTLMPANTPFYFAVAGNGTVYEVGLTSLQVGAFTGTETLRLAGGGSDCNMPVIKGVIQSSGNTCH